MNEGMVESSFMGSYSTCNLETTSIETGIFQKAPRYYPREVMDNPGYGKSEIVNVLFGDCIHLFNWPTKIHESIKIT